MLTNKAKYEIAKESIIATAEISNEMLKLRRYNSFRIEGRVMEDVCLRVDRALKLYYCELTIRTTCLTQKTLKVYCIGRARKIALSTFRVNDIITVKGSLVCLTNPETNEKSKLLLMCNWCQVIKWADRSQPNTLPRKANRIVEDMEAIQSTIFTVESKDDAELEEDAYKVIEPGEDL